jgi:hypothetical protein
MRIWGDPMVIEATILKVAEAAADRTYGPVLSKISVLAAQHRLKSAAQPAVPAAAADAVSDQLRPVEAHQIVSYVNSPEFEELAFQLALSAAIDSPRRESDAVDKVRKQLVAHLGRTDLDAGSRDEVADLLVDTLNQAIAVCATRNVRDGRVSKRQVTSSASLAAAQVRNAELLARVGELSQVFEFGERIRAQVRRVHSQIEIQHIGNRQRVAYNQLWVKPLLAYDHFPEKGTPQKSPASAAKPDHSTISLAPDSLFQFQRCVVLGDPGAGKSTLANWLAYAISGDEISQLAARVPFFLILREHSAALTDSSFSIVKQINSQCHAQYHVEPPERAVEYLLRNGRAVVILDGLDELLIPVQRYKALRLIENFCEEYPTTPVLVTARRVGYQEAGFDKKMFSIVSLSPFTEDQVTEYVTKWFRLDDGLPAGEPGESGSEHRLAAAFLEESSNIVELRSNPLLLALLCALYRWDGYLPQNRPKVYEDCTKLLLERWDLVRGISIDLPERQSLRGALPEIAWWIWSERSGHAAGVSRTALENKITDYLVRNRFDNRDTAEDVAARFVDFCSGRAWVLMEVGSVRGEGLYAFTHRTFMEYFAALHLVRSFPEPSDLLPYIIDQITSGGGAIVAELAVHELDSRTGSGSDFLDLLMDLVLDGSAFTRRPVIAFAARCLAFLSPRESTMRRIVDSALDLSLRSIRPDEAIGARMAYAALAPEFDYALFSLINEVSHDNRGFVESYLKKRLTVGLQGAISVEREVAENITALAAALYSEGADRTAQTPLGEMLTAVTDWSEIEAALRLLAPRAPWASAFLVAKGMQTLDAAFALHGPMIFYLAAEWTFFEVTVRLAPPVEQLAHLLTGTGPSAEAGSLAIESPETLLSGLVGTRPPWLAPGPYSGPGVENDFLGRALEADGPVDRALWSLALVASLPLVESAWETSIEARRNRLRIDTAWAREWLSMFPGMSNQKALVSAFSDALTDHGLLDFCQELVEEWLRCDISLLRPGSSRSR